MPGGEGGADGAFDQQWNILISITRAFSVTQGFEENIIHQCTKTQGDNEISAISAG